MTHQTKLTDILNPNKFKNWKTRTIKEAIYWEENEHHINGISFKLTNIWKPMQRKTKAKKTTSKTTTSSNWAHKGPPTSIVPHKSATKINQSKTTLKYFDPLRTHKYHKHSPCLILFIGMNIVFWNCQGLRPKRKELENYLLENQIAILALKETFLKPKFKFHLPGYDIYKNDRLVGTKGGVAILVKKASL